MTEPDLVRWYREQLEVYSAQLAIRDKQLAQTQRALDAANATIAVRDAAWDVAWDVARDVARATATATATVVVRDAAWDVARDDQASCLRKNCKPCFAKTEGM